VAHQVPGEPAQFAETAVSWEKWEIGIGRGADRRARLKFTRHDDG
jgi:hypothetical protein